MKISTKYSIKFPIGQTLIMTLKSIHSAPANQNHKVKYVFIDDSGSTVKLTRGVCKRVIIKEHFAFSIRIDKDDLYL